MKAYEVYHGRVNEGIPVTFKNEPKPHIVIWDDDGSYAIKIVTDGWDEKNLPTKIENVEVIQKPEGWVIRSKAGVITNDDPILVFWSWTSPEGGDVELYAKSADINIIKKTSYTYDGMRIAGLLAVLRKGQYLGARVADRYGRRANWKISWNGIKNGIKGSEVSTFKGIFNNIRRRFSVNR